MIQTTQMHKFFRIIFLLFISRFASSTGEDMSSKSYCITPIEYFIELTFNIENNSFIVTSAALVNVSCTVQDTEIDGRQYCDISTYTISYISDDLTCAYCAAKLSLLTKERFTLECCLSNIVEVFERIDFFVTRKEREKHIIPGMYWINAKYTCSLDRVATVFTYADESEAKKFLLLSRIPADWIFPYSISSSIKARFTIRINYKDTETAISNMPIQGIMKTNTSIYTVFYTTPVMPSSMIAAVVLPTNIIEATFSLLNKVNMKSSLQIRNSTSYARSIIKDITKSMRDKWENIPRLHVHYVALPLNFSNYESIVTTGLVLFREADIVYDREIDSIIRRREVTCLVARSVIQEMFSNWLATFKESDAWFIEGFSTYYGAYIVDQISDEPLLKSIVVQTRREFFDYIEAVFRYVSIYEYQSHNSTVSKLWRIKVFSLFNMLNVLSLTPSSTIQEVIMEEAINVYYSTSYDNYNKLSTPNDIWTRLEFNENFKKNTRFSNLLNMKNVITFWTTQVGYPVVQVQRNIDKQLLTVKVIDCFGDIQGEQCSRKFWIPVMVTYVKIQKDTNTLLETMYLLPQRDRISSITKEDFIIIVKQTGYRVNYDRQTWKNIAAFLKTVEPNFLNIHDITLAQILDDAFYFLVQNSSYTDYNSSYTHSNDTDFDIFFDLANNLLRRNCSYIEWYPMLTALEYMSKVFPYSESAIIKDKILTILNMFLEDKSHNHSSENTVSNQLYHEVIKWICILDDLKCEDHINAILQWHFKNHIKNKLLPSWQKWIYCQGLKFETVPYEKSDLWVIIVNIHQFEETVEFLTCSTYNRSILQSLFAFQRNRYVPHLGYIGNKINNASKVKNLFDMFAKHSKNVASLNMILAGIKKTTLRAFEREVPLLAVVNCIINHIYSNEGLYEIYASDYWLREILLDMFERSKAQLMLEVIREKVISRHNFLKKMQSIIRNRPHDALNYKNMSK